MCSIHLPFFAQNASKNAKKIFFFFKRFLCDHLGLYYILHIQLRDDDDGDEGMGQGGRRGERFRESVAVSP